MSEQTKRAVRPSDGDAVRDAEDGDEVETPTPTTDRPTAGRESGDAVDPETLDPESVDESELVRTEDGELIHEETGLVVEEDRVDRGPEWRAFSQQERQERSRVGSPTTKARHDEGLTTTIGWRDEDANGRSLTQEKRRRMKRLRTWQQRIRTQKTGERNLQFALSEAARMSSALGLPDSVQEIAAVIYRRALDEDLIRGRSIEGVATAALYAACRQEAVPRSLDEVSDVSRVEREEIGRAYRHLSAELGLELQPVDPSDYVPRYCSELDLDEHVARKAEEIVRETASKGLHAGKSPSGFAASAIYLAAMLCNEKRTQKSIADVAGVTEVTVRNGYQEQMSALGLIDG